MGSIPWHNDWLTISCNVTWLSKLSSSSVVRVFTWYVLEVAMKPATGAGRRRLKWEPARSTLWLHRASLNSTPHWARTSEEQALPAVFLVATPSADFDYSRPVIAINSRPVTSRAPPQASYNASGVFTVCVNKRAYHLQTSINCGYPHK
jgi:hypothetical protein